MYNRNFVQNESHFSGNEATTGDGGAIYSTGANSYVTVERSTFDGNTARENGGLLPVYPKMAKASLQ